MIANNLLDYYYYEKWYWKYLNCFTYEKGIDRTVGIAVSESALLPPKYSFSTFLICFFSFSLSFFVRSSYFFWLRSASFWAFSFLDSTFFLNNNNYKILQITTINYTWLKYEMQMVILPVLHHLHCRSFVQVLKHLRFTMYSCQLHCREKI